MKITDAKVIVTCPGRNFVTVKILTDQGVHGIGDATLGPFFMCAWCLSREAARAPAHGTATRIHVLRLGHRFR